MDNLIEQMDSYNVMWDTPSNHAGESMPVGGGDIGLNVWVEDGDILFYIARSGTFDENNQMLKLGRVRLRITPNPFKEIHHFQQVLKLYEGYIEITASDVQGKSIKVDVWVEVHQPIVHVEIHSDDLVEVEATYENWRLQEGHLAPGKWRHPALSTMGFPSEIQSHPDVISFLNDGVMFYHRNQSDDLIFNKLVDQQGLGHVRDQMWNPQLNSTFGGIMYGDDFSPVGTIEDVYIQTSFRGWCLKSTAQKRSHHVQIHLHTAQTTSIDQWVNELMNFRNIINDLEDSRARTRTWWSQYWQRSHIFIQMNTADEDDKRWQVGRNYHLFRYMLGCNAYGAYPTKFNGGLFTTDPVFVESDRYSEEELLTATPDFRMWGGGSFTAQNQRLVYWPMLKTGDFDMMPAQFEFYRRGLKNAELRTEVYFEHKGCSFAEQVENFGLPVGYEWGWMDSDDLLHRRTSFSDPTEQLSPWVRYHYVNQLEFSFMILKYHEYCGADIASYLPFIESSIRFFDEHYQYRHFINTGRRLDAEGNLVIWPSTACETYKNALNPTDVISALRATVSAILALPEQLISTEKRDYYLSLQTRLPELSYRDMNGYKTIAPAETWKEIINVEVPQLYPVFPYELYGIGRPDLETAINTWRYGIELEAQKDHRSWHQDNIFCARMGLTEEAAAYAIRKLQNSPRRFPAFWGPGHDWVPDHNWGGSGMIGLQDMLLQTAGNTIYLFPAWPKQWDVDFKLHAPQQTMVEGKVRDGELVALEVTPSSRLVNVVNMWVQ